MMSIGLREQIFFLFVSKNWNCSTIKNTYTYRHTQVNNMRVSTIFGGVVVVVKKALSWKVNISLAKSSFCERLDRYFHLCENRNLERERERRLAGTPLGLSSDRSLCR